MSHNNNMAAARKQPRIYDAHVKQAILVQTTIAISSEPLALPSTHRMKIAPVDSQRRKRRKRGLQSTASIERAVFSSIRLAMSAIIVHISRRNR